MKQSPAAWRGVSSRVRTGDAAGTNARRNVHDESLAARARHEIAEHPSETVALVAMTIAVARLWMRRERAFTFRPGGSRRKRAIAPMALMAAICLLMVTGCATVAAPVVEVAPDPLTFGRDYADDLVIAGEKVARERCVSCHQVDPGSGRAAAPPLRALLRKRSADQLADDLLAGLPMGHAGMPVFDFNLVAALSLVAYLESLETTGSPQS